MRSFLSSFAFWKSIVFSSSTDFNNLDKFSKMTSLISFLLASFSMYSQWVVKPILPSVCNIELLLSASRSFEYIFSSSAPRAFSTASTFSMDLILPGMIFSSASMLALYRALSSTPYTFIGFSETTEKNSPADILPLRIRYSAVSLRISWSGNDLRSDMSTGPSAPSRAIRLRS